DCLAILIVSLEITTAFATRKRSSFKMTASALSLAAVEPYKFPKNQLHTSGFLPKELAYIVCPCNG
ncbi:hypothetical protein, partial [Corynebacterium sp. HMSC08A12]|uniref:hypothetical protein n=1 Tax=Corynebacterium sp. HMSC08A12 TaxID=1581134 RepID=UPI001AF01F44